MTTTPPPAGFTPGPWTAQTKAEMTPATAQLIRPNGYSAYVSAGTVAGAGGWLALASVIVKTEDGESAEGAANARLIAAAPCLYAACKAAVDGFALGVGAVGCTSDDPDIRANADRCIREAREIMDQLRAALAKAGGGA